MSLLPADLLRPWSPAAQGPVNIHESVLRAMHVPGQNHRDPWFPEFYKKCLSDLKMIFGTSDGTTIIFPGTGTGGWESALTNTLSPGDKVVTFRYGLFSHLWIDMMQRLGLDVTVIEGRWGDGAYEDRLAEVLAADREKKIKAVCVVHNETTTGVTSDIPEVRSADGSPASSEAAEATSGPLLLRGDCLLYCRNQKC
jgi:alanine-glyoxylate transaminase/serine-glyoxylate transaminase/serine-pyruvate transaminase